LQQPVYDVSEKKTPLQDAEAGRTRATKKIKQLQTTGDGRRRQPFAVVFSLFFLVFYRTLASALMLLQL